MDVFVCFCFFNDFLFYFKNLIPLLQDKPFRSVSVSDFQSHLSRSKSVADMLKIFFDDPNLTEEQVRQIMFMKSHQGLYASNGETSSRRGHMMSDLGSNSTCELGYYIFCVFFSVWLSNQWFDLY